MRKTFLQLHKITLNQLIELYQKDRDTNTLAKRFNVCSRTIRKALNRAGIYGTKGCYPGVKRRDTGQVQQWLNKHPEITLPSSWRKARILTGLPKSVVNSYFIYRRRRMKKLLQDLIIPKTAQFTAKDGQHVSFKDVHRYRVRGNYRTGDVRITAHLKDRVAVIKTTIAELKERKYV